MGGIEEGKGGKRKSEVRKKIEEMYRGLGN